MDAKIASLSVAPRFMLSERAQMTKRLEIQKEYLQSLSDIEISYPDIKTNYRPNEKKRKKQVFSEPQELQEYDMDVFNIVLLGEKEKTGNYHGWKGAKITETLILRNHPIIHNSHDPHKIIMLAINRLISKNMVHRTSGLFRPRDKALKADTRIENNDLLSNTL